jgi:TP53 regulating kinase-like protein
MPHSNATWIAGIGEGPAHHPSLLYRGAEADLYLAEWGNAKALIKARKALPYRLPVIDKRIRRQRTVREAEIIVEARQAGVRTPRIYFVDDKNSIIVMEFISGEKLKEHLGHISEEKASTLFIQTGAAIGKMHLAGIIHGDLTTSNIIVRGSHLFFVDFGLSIHSTKLEDRAVDVRLVKETLTGAHSQISSFAFSSFLRGYRSVVGETEVTKVSRKLAEIERRGRYARIE